MNRSATVLRSRKPGCPLARRGRCIAAARVGLGHRPALPSPALLPSTSLHFKTEGNLQCRKISTGNAATSSGGRGQTECGGEDNLPRAVGFREGKGRQGGAQTPSQRGQAPSAQPPEGVLHLFRGRSYRSDGRDIYHPVSGLPEPLERRENQTLFLGPRMRKWLLTPSQVAVSTAPEQLTQLWLNREAEVGHRSVQPSPLPSLDQADPLTLV